MNKKVLVIVVVTLLLIASGVAYLLSSSDDKTAKQDMIGREDKMTETAPPGTQTMTMDNSQAGAYVNYSSSAIAESSGTKLLFFHAQWCPQCRAIEADIKQDGVPAGVTIIKVDYDTNQALRQKYGITLQTTFVRIDDQGNLVEKFVAYDEPTLDSVKKNLL